MRFLKIVFGSCLGSILALVLIVVAASSFFAATIGNIAEQKPSVNSNSVLYLDMSDGLSELTGNKETTSLNPENVDPPGLHDMVRVLEAAADDDNIKGLYLRNTSVPGALSSVRVLRDAVQTFKESGKFVTAYAPYYEQSGYYLASVADEINLGPLGIVDFRGLSAEVPFFKRGLDKAGIKMEVFKVGEYKSAVEPFLRNEMSPESREQTKAFLEDLYGVMIEDISSSRNLDPSILRRAASEMTGWKDQDALREDLVDGILSRTEMDQKIHDLLGLDYDQSLNLISSTDYYAARLNRLRGGGAEVAVLIAEGNIVDGNGQPGSIGDKKYVNELEKLKKDDDVKAVVLRVNSGGGSASSSENIWYAVEELQEAGKPVVVSMGDYAASGGYYIAAGADKIYAEPTTITGSIGVFITFPILKELMNEKLGVNFDTVNTARNSSALSTFQNFTPEQRQVLQTRTEAVYGQFKKRVADGRDLPLSTVDKIAGGRVYSGIKALDIGLVDELGGLETAIADAAERAGLEDYSVGHYPRMLPSWERLINDLLGMDDNDNQVTGRILRAQLGEEAYEQYRFVRDMTQLNGPQTRLPLVLRF